MQETIESLLQENAALKSALTDLKKNKHELELVIENTGVGIWDWNVQTGETIFNERWANIIGYTLAELGELSIKTWLKFAHPDDLQESERLLKAHWSGESEYYLFESRMKHKKGHWIWVYDTGRVVEWESEGVPKRMIGTHLDITDKKVAIANLDAANKQLKKLSYIDALTQIPNRRAYEEKIKTEISVARRANSFLAILMIDIDNFKEFNDTYGHDKGDEVLLQVSQLIKTALPRKTDFVARYGGEEIAIILPFTQLNGAINIAKTIVEQVFSSAIEHQHSCYDKSVTVSVGVACSDSSYEKLMHFADEALYEAKRKGRNRYEVHTTETIT
ncbi:sensor domain-containing diguanylate cyclase [Psychrobium sp. 1_MG-2023]|uniref:GGDEF domain-containing protein n=1 Tax=Psychrobium sp. 1_MG-2023 TaxID=3062624 RepID=UPI0026CFCBAC|nr:sensor domain-containing diguanylate cyclase [Psychrobium sp. 1_MG-2023]MDP2561524.1 sensor domain-containing diguanylate cyclase [Psychrobium sp. 1_MG-2023]